MQALTAPVLLDYTNMNAKHSMDKGVPEAACWNWALYGARPLPIAHPDALFGFVNRGPLEIQTRASAETQLTTNTGHVWDHLQTGQQLRTDLNQIRLDYDQSNDDTATRNNIRDAIFELAVRAAGYTISNAVTPYRICIFEPQDVVMWDHWWLEINGVVVETVTGDKLFAFSDEYLAPAFNHPRNRVANKAHVPGLSPAQQARVHSRYVTSLQDEQATYLEIVKDA